MADLIDLTDLTAKVYFTRTYGGHYRLQFERKGIPEEILKTIDDALSQYHSFIPTYAEAITSILYILKHTRLHITPDYQGMPDPPPERLTEIEIALTNRILNWCEKERNGESRE